jgi:hypothetical protein
MTVYPYSSTKNRHLMGLVSRIEFRSPVYQACVRFALREYSKMNLKAAAIIELK